MTSEKLNLDVAILEVGICVAGDFVFFLRDERISVSAFTSKELYCLRTISKLERPSLEKWMKTHKIKKASQALTIILEHYLEGNIPIEVMPENLEEEVKQLKVKTTEIDGIEATLAEQQREFNDEIAGLRTEIDGLRQALINAGLSSLREKVEDIPRGKIKSEHSDWSLD